MNEAKRQAAIRDAWSAYGVMCNGARAQQQEIVMLAGAKFDKDVRPFREQYEITVSAADDLMHKTEKAAYQVLQKRLDEIG